MYIEYGMVPNSLACFFCFRKQELFHGSDDFLRWNECNELKLSPVDFYYTSHLKYGCIFTGILPLLYNKPLIAYSLTDNINYNLRCVVKSCRNSQ